MPFRNLSSLIRRTAGAALGALLITLAQPALAENPAGDDGEIFRLRSLFPGSLFQSKTAEEVPAQGINPDTPLVTYELSPLPVPPGPIDLTAQNDNLWERIRNGFAMPDLNDDLTLYYQQWYQSRPDALRRMVERSRPFMHFIVQELETRGMPTELALLPMVESSFNTMAYSHASAAGLWQFIPATGKRFNLEQNWWQDKRRDVVASTVAALDYLQTIYDMHGDWHLALASYNWGEGAVKRAIEKNQARGLPTDYANLTMPNETRHYVPKLQALKNIFGNPALMVELRLPEILNRPYLSTIDASRPMDVKTAARLANMPVEEFRALNPSHNRPVIQADSAIVLPTDKVSTFRDNLARHAGPLSEWQTYTLSHGERLRQIAPRFGISTPELARVNSLPGDVRLGAGSTLLVPAGGGGMELNSRLPSMTQIIEAERVCKKKQKRCQQQADRERRSAGKAGRDTDANDRKHAGRHDAKAEKGKKAGREKSTERSARNEKGGKGKNNAKSAATENRGKGKNPSKTGSTPKAGKSAHGRRG